jgi:hypothetical protein
MANIHTHSHTCTLRHTNTHMLFLHGLVCTRDQEELQYMYAIWRGIIAYTHAVRTQVRILHIKGHAHAKTENYKNVDDEQIDNVGVCF